VRVLDCNGAGDVGRAINAVNWVINNAQRPAVANMSLRFAPSDTLDAAVNNAVNNGIFFAVSAGNQNLEACSQSPARAAQAVAVMATDSYDSRASFSNFGNCADIFAPGVSILSAWHTGDSATQTLNGTSMAAPHVTGVAALFFDEDSNLTAINVRDRILARSTRNEVSNAGTNSPNRLLYSLTLGAGGLPQMPAYLDVQPWMCNGYNDVFWTNADGAVQHELYMSSSSSFTTQTLVYVGTATDYLANVGGTRYFRIRSCGPTGCSAWRYGDQPAVKANGCL
jgi:subtilisin family serine protease